MSALMKAISELSPFQNPNKKEAADKNEYAAFRALLEGGERLSRNETSQIADRISNLQIQGQEQYEGGYSPPCRPHPHCTVSAHAYPSS